MEYVLQQSFCLSGLVACVTLLFYLRVVDFTYVWDDTDIFLGRIDTLMKSGFGFADLGKPFLGNMEYFRPLVILSYCLDVSIAGFDPGFSHATNLLIFILNGFLVFSVCRILAERTGHPAPVAAAFLASLIYALHPALIETTAWISGRFDLLVTFFILVATRLYLSQAKPVLKILLVSGITLLSLLCKETGVVFPLTILCLWSATHAQENGHFYKNALRENAGFLAAFCLVFVLYLVMRLNVEGGAYLRHVAQINPAYLAEKSFLALESIKLYLVLAFLPFSSISAQHPVDYVISAWSLKDILGNLLTLSLLGSILFFAIRKRSPAAWIFIAGFTYLLLVLHIVPIRIGKNLASDRFLSAPLAFWVMAVTLVRYDRIFANPHLRQIFSSMHVLSVRSLLWGTVTCWVLFSALTTYTTIPLWKNSLSLWSWTYSLYPRDRFTRDKYTFALIASGRPDLLKQEIKEIKENLKENLKEDKGAIQLLYGNLLLADRDPEALPLLRRIIEENSELLAAADMEQQQDMEDSEDSLGAKRTVAYLYSLYAEATLLFEMDVEKSLRFSEKARGYAEQLYGEKQVKAWLGFREIAILYAAGRFDEGDALRAEIIAFSRNPETLDSSVADILQQYCRENPGPAACTGIRSKMRLLP
ncbi:MAG: hypothetical protein LBO00_00410 [Zoogloeaceae bacterium]|jgi:hypothetical protein|nr:hypothetical protein [Zoogloeaceae bacterium]